MFVHDAHLGGRFVSREEGVDGHPDVEVDRTRPISSISTAAPKVGGPSRSSTLFCTRRLLASSSPSVTLATPPTRSFSVGFFRRFSSVCPCAVAIICTPRCEMVRAACASSSVPISSTTITSGVWFCTASMSTWCCESGLGTCMRRAAPMPGCGMSPSPPISFEVSRRRRVCRIPRITRGKSRESPSSFPRRVDRGVTRIDRTRGGRGRVRRCLGWRDRRDR